MSKNLSGRPLPAHHSAESSFELSMDSEDFTWYRDLKGGKKEITAALKLAKKRDAAEIDVH